MALALLLVGLGVTTTAASAASPIERATACGDVLVSGSAWLGGTGVPVRSNGPNMASPDNCATNGPNHDGVDSTNPAVQAGGGWQSVELAARLYFVKGWGVVGTVGNGGAAYIPDGSPSLKPYRNGSGYIPVPGDLIIEKATATNPYGHVSIVDSLIGSTINVVEQNASVSGRETYTLTGSSIAGGYSAVWGVVHSPKNSGDFQVSVAPSTSKVAAGQSAQFAVGSKILAGTALPLNLSVTGLPPGAKAAFSVNPIQTGSGTNLTVTTSTRNPAGGTPGGVYELSLKGVAGGQARTAGFTLQVKNPNTPVLNSAQYTDGGVNLFFTPPSALTGTTIRYYRYQLSFDGGASITYDNIAQDVDSPFLAGGCQVGQVCTYRIAAVVDTGTSAWSSWKKVTPIATPVLKSGKYTDGGVNLFFTPPTVPTGTTIRYYRYQLSFDGGASVTYDNIAQDVDSPFLAGGCQVGQVCTYRIAAVVDTGTSAWSSWKKVTPIATPVLNRAKYTDGGVNLFFTPPTLPTGTTIRYYRYQLSFDGGLTTNYDSYSQDVDSPFVANGCQSGQVCTYRIAAVVDAGVTAWSNWKTATL